MDNALYIEYVNSNIEEIANYVDSCFEASKETLRKRFIQMIKGYITPIPTHFEWKPIFDYYDKSGIIVEDGLISLDQTISEFLENEYDGAKIATFESGCGWHFTTYNDSFSYDTLEIASDIMFPAIRKNIEDKFNIKLTEDMYEEIKENCNDFDEIYDNCVAADFFYGIAAIKFVGIENMKLSDLV